MSFLLLRFLWTSKENEEVPKALVLCLKLRGEYLLLIIPKPIRNFHTVLV
ncbi:MAG: hypothetical protein H6554_10665 [Chitinophagales bacterium]|nr:hypothetical protein [Chitinophagales bacterium]